MNSQHKKDDFISKLKQPAEIIHNNSKRNSMIAPNEKSNLKINTNNKENDYIENNYVLNSYKNEYKKKALGRSHTSLIHAEQKYKVVQNNPYVVSDSFRNTGDTNSRDSSMNKSTFANK